MSVTYPFDTSGVSPANLVKDELHAVSEAVFRDYFFLIPNFAPFYVDNFKLFLLQNGTRVPLNEDVDFSFTLPYVTGTRTTGKQIYGGVTLHNLEMTGILVMEYQTVGGPHVVDRLHVLSYLADKAYNPRTTIWDIITNVPEQFPPVPHYQDYDNFKGQEEVVDVLSEIRDAILSNSSLTSDKIQAFLDEFLQGSSAVYVKTAGGVMTGPLILSGEPVAPLQAATKQFVQDTTISRPTLNAILNQYATITMMMENLNEKLSLTGGIMTGPIKLSADPVVAEDAVRKAYVDGLISGVNATMAAMQQAITNLQNTVATKAYVDDLVNQIRAKTDGIILHKR